MTSLNSTLRATRFFSLSSSDDDPDDDETNTEGLDDGGDLNEEDGDLDFDDDGEDSPAGGE